jgi:hypothetical protein
MVLFLEKKMIAQKSFPAMLTLDAGWSDTKVIWRVSPFRPELVMMPPEVAEISRESIDFYKSRRVTIPAPENEAWVDIGGTYYVVGFLAQKLNAPVVLSRTKYEFAIAKVLAATGVMALREGLGEKFELALALPLPYSEWADRNRFERDVRKALSSFTFCDKPLMVELDVLLSVPEGGGHVIAVGSSQGAAFNHNRIVSLMWGYRDISVIQFDRGVISGKTEPMGFYKLMEMIQSRISGSFSRERERLLLQAVHSAGKDIKSKNVMHLASSQNPDRHIEEVGEMIEAIKLCRNEYWEMACRVLQMYIPPHVDEIIVGGGVCDYYRSELRKFLLEKFSVANISWGASLEEDVRIAFNLPQKEKVLCSRLTDAYALSNFLRSKVCHLEYLRMDQDGASKENS